MEPQTIEFVGAPCGQHGPYTFYKAFKFSLNHKYRILSLGEFFFVKISETAPVAIGELQLLWEDKNNESVYMTSVRLYFLPEHTPEGRQEYHGQDEILAENEKFVLRVEDLCAWITETVEWPIGAKAVCEDDIKEDPEHADLTKLFKANNCGLELTDVTKEKELIGEAGEARLCNVTILSYSRYVRYRSIMKRLEGVSSSWLKNAIVSAIGGFTAPIPGTRIVFCRDTFDHPDLLTHDFRQDHLAPNLKGRPRKKKMKAKRDMESDSNDSDFTPGKEERAMAKISKEGGEHKMRRQVLRPNKDKVTAVEQNFIKELMAHMKRRKTPIDRIPSLGFKQIDLYYFYNYAQKLGGYEQITKRRLWKHLYDRLGGNPGSTSAATCTRRHYERLLLSYERFQKGEKDIDIPINDDDDDDNGTDDSKNNDLGDSDNNYSPQNDIAELDSIPPPANIAKPASALPQPATQKTVLAEQSLNHIKSQQIDLTQASAKRLDSKENGVTRHEPAAPVAPRPQPQGLPGVQGEPNMVMVVSKNGEMSRAHRGAPSIMNTGAKPRQNVPTGPKGPPPALIGPFPINQQGMHPQLLPGQRYHHNNMAPRPGMPPVSYHHLQQQQKQQQHLQTQQQQQQNKQQQQHQQQQQKQQQQQHAHTNNHQLSRHHVLSSTKGSLRGPSTLSNGPGVRYMGEVKDGQPRHMPHGAAHGRPHSAGNPPAHDPNRPSVIQHTQVKPEICIPPPARHTQTVFGPPHLRPGAQPPTAGLGLKRGYPFSPSTSPRLDTPPPTPPSAHNSRHNPSVYFRDLDPYAKRQHLHGPSSSPVPGLAPVLPPHREPVNHRVVAEDEPTDLSIKKHKPAPQPLHSNSYHNHSQGSAPAPEDAPLNLVMHKRSRDTPPQQRSSHPQPPRSSSSSSNSSSIGLHGHSRPPSTVTSSSHLALPYDHNPSSKVPPKDMNSAAASVRTAASPRTLPEAHRGGGGGGGLLPHPHHHQQQRPTASPHHPSHIISPLSLHQGQKLTAGPPVNPGMPRLSLDHPWNTPGAATPVSASSADFAAALLHPAFPQLAPHIMPGLLPPNIPPHVFYEAQLRATHSAAGPTPTTDSNSQRPPTQMVLSTVPQTPVNYRK